jgi:hypothetical protein
MDAPRPQETLRDLCEMFPSFEEWWKDEQAPPEDGLVDGVYYKWTHHRVMFEFLEYFGQEPRVLYRETAQTVWLNAAVSSDSELENAISTCFLEHMHQVTQPSSRAVFIARGKG